MLYPEQQEHLSNRIRKAKQLAILFEDSKYWGLAQKQYIIVQLLERQANG